MLGARCTTLFPREMLPIVDLVDVASRSGEPTDRVEAEVVRPDGLRVPVLIAARPVRAPGGDVVGSVVAVRDVTEQRRLRGMSRPQLVAATPYLPGPQGGRVVPQEAA